MRGSSVSRRGLEVRWKASTVSSIGLKVSRRGFAARWRLFREYKGNNLEQNWLISELDGLNSKQEGLNFEQEGSTVRIWLESKLEGLDRKVQRF